MVDFYKSKAFPYPVPDPYWRSPAFLLPESAPSAVRRRIKGGSGDYAVTWHELQEVKQTVEKLIEDMIFIEHDSEDFDRHKARVTERMRERLKDIADNNSSAYIDSADDLDPLEISQ
jgi:hypothetical protein